jgi:hypothetical protein
MCVRVGVHVCLLGWRSCMCYGGRSCMYVRVGVHVCVLGWDFMYVCYGGHSCMCVRWVFMYMC